ncbi:MAG: YjjG family noncanonical pyrimidine nucleotidase [Bacteroidales bacterium]|jgi:putative hydrolase of the HAD superfamily|nr:YjjG family noncanonical pyrimidine nucleotidase [Bacteroidales bacterium]
MQYRNIYFDLDRTLWDFESNSKDTFRDIFDKYNLIKDFGDFDVFLNTYKKHNERLWKLYRIGQIKKSVLRYKRFSLTLEEYGITNDDLAQKMGDDYITISPTKKKLFPNTHETLEYLSKKYNLYIITNGFNEVQFVKMKNCKLDKYFDKVFTSENAGAQKPNKKIFKFALSSVNAKKTESIMIGDDLESDILGAKNYGLDQVFFNAVERKHKEKNITYEINSLKELQKIL